jgi:hypothetical protein
MISDVEGDEVDGDHGSRLHSYFSIVTVSSSKTGPRPVINQLRLKLVETGLKTVKNRLKPH